MVFMDFGHVLWLHLSLDLGWPSAGLDAHIVGPVPPDILSGPELPLAFPRRWPPRNEEELCSLIAETG